MKLLQFIREFSKVSKVKVCFDIGVSLLGLYFNSKTLGTISRINESKKSLEELLKLLSKRQ